VGVTGFLLSASVCTPLAGKLGDLFGKARVLTAVLAIFTAGAIVCALAPSIEVLIAGRVVSGVAGGVSPLAFAIINDELPTERRALAIGLMSAMFRHRRRHRAAAVGDHRRQRRPLVAVPRRTARRARRRRGPQAGPPVTSAGAHANRLGRRRRPLGRARRRAARHLQRQRLGLGFGGDGRHDRGRAPAARLLRRARDAHHRPAGRHARHEAAPGAGHQRRGVPHRPGDVGSFLLVPQFAQTPEQAGYGFAMTVTQAGLVMLPTAAIMLFAGPVGGMLGGRIGFRYVLMLGTVLAAGSFLMLAFTHEQVWEFVIAGVLMGAGISFAFASMANLVVVSVPAQDVGIATGINTIMRTMGGAFGAAIVTALLTAETIPGTPLPDRGRLHRGLPHLRARGPARPGRRGGDPAAAVTRRTCRPRASP
jgi:hypothetical protein